MYSDHIVKVEGLDCQAKMQTFSAIVQLNAEVMLLPEEMEEAPQDCPILFYIRCT